MLHDTEVWFEVTHRKMHRPCENWVVIPLLVDSNGEMLLSEDNAVEE